MDVTPLPVDPEATIRLFDLALDMLCVADFNGVMLQVNPAWTECLGWSAQELTSRPMIEFILPEDHAVTQEVRKDIYRGIPVRGFENRYRCKDGSYRWLSWNVHPVLQSRRVFAVARDVTAKKQAETEAQRSADQYRLLFQSNPHPMWTYDLETLRFLAVNDAAVKHYGYSEQEFLAMTIRQLRPPEDRRVQSLNIPTGRGQRPDRRKHRRKDGSIIIVEISSDSVVFDGRPASLVLAHDVTERVRAEMALLESEERFRQLAETIDEAFWVSSPEKDSILYISPAYEAIWGRSCHSLYSNPGSWLDALHPEDAPRIRHATATRQITGEYDETYRIVRPDGSVRWIRDRAFPVRTPDGVVYRLVGIAQDVTTQKQAEQRIAEQAALLDKANDAITVLDLEGRILFWNHGAERIFGRSATEAVGQSTRDLLFTDPSPFEQALRDVLAQGEWSGEFYKRTAGGPQVCLNARWTLLRTQSGQPHSILAIETDVTEAKILEAQLRRAQRMESIGTLAGGIAHDLNNVLTPILLSIELLRDEIPGTSGDELLHTMQISAERGADLVRQVLTFARGVEGQRVQVDPVHLVGDLLKVMRETLPKAISLQFRHAPDMWTVTGDPTQLNQVFMNLFVNARDAMPEGGQLTVTMTNAVLDETYTAMTPEAQPGSFVNVSVTDTGMGIAPEHRERIFEPFFTTKEVGQGTGLGLSTTLAIVRSHGGFITLDSEPGNGARFTVHLPATPVPGDRPPVPAVQPNRMPSGQGETVLVVDDEAAVREVVRSTLERHGYQVLLASHGAEAVSIYAQKQKDIALVLTDMAMPIMDGPSLIAALRSMNPDVLIVGSSGLQGNGGIGKAIGAGVQQFIPKPYSAETVLTTLHQLLH